MENMELDEGQEIFLECDTFVSKDECKDYLIDLNLQHEIEKGLLDKNIDFNKRKQTNNNHHIVHVGIIIVLLTIYLGTISVQKCVVNCVENASIAKQQKTKFLNYLQEKEKLENNKILERLLEYKDICKDLEIFTKATERKSLEKQKEEEYHRNEILKDIEVTGGAIEEENSMEYEYSSGSNGNDNCAPADRNKSKKSKYSIKTTGTKNGFNKYNKSTKFKYQKNPKKDLNLNKKNSTAEPIIYLFALVFIYLLLKAASDINQHYKTQNKNDKRLRRCSLQSYAQTHRPDRRASKELALKHKQQQLQERLKSLSRSSSQDQQNYNYNHHQRQQYLMEGSIRKSIEQTQQANTVSPKSSYSNNWQLLRQHTTTQSVDSSDIVNSARGNPEISSPMMARRCSVPAALSYPKQKFSTPQSLSTVNDHVNLSVASSRRTSITSSPLYLPMDYNESLALEVKRRVRMINRH